MSQSLSSMRWDMTWNGMLVWIWLIIECDLAIICISVPVLRLLVRRFIPRWSIPTSITKSTQGTHIASGRHHTAKQEASLTSLIQEGRILKTDVIELHGRARSETSLPRSRGNDYGYHDYAPSQPPRSRGEDGYRAKNQYLRSDVSRAV
jgi:hypothetical protein